MVEPVKTGQDTDVRPLISFLFDLTTLAHSFVANNS